MAYQPATCDNSCDGCEKNLNGWCTFKDIAASNYSNYAYNNISANITTSNKAEFSL